MTMLVARIGVSSEGGAPDREVSAPQSRWASARRGALITLVAGALAAVVGACNNGADQVTAPIVLGMTSNVTPIYSSQQLTLYEVQVPVKLPVRKPTSQEEQALNGAEAPYPHKPFLLSSDYSLEIRFTISNLDTERHAVYLLIDPWNEFVRYHPGVSAFGDEETLPNTSGYQNSFLIDGMSRVEGTITTDDTTALALGLATVMKIASLPVDPMAAYDTTTLMDNTFDLQNRPLANDPLIAPYIPSVIAGLTGFDLGLRTDTAENVSVEIVVDITDLNGNHLIPQGQSGTTIGIPSKILSPAAAPTTVSGG